MSDDIVRKDGGIGRVSDVMVILIDVIMRYDVMA